MRMLGIAYIAQRPLSKVLHDSRHHLLKPSGCINANESTFIHSVILKVMMSAAWDKGIATTRRVRPLALNEKADGAGQDVKNVVFRVGVCTGTAGAWLQPPFRNGVSSVRLFSVGEEDPPACVPCNTCAPGRA
jgi:hypothetical protein